MNETRFDLTIANGHVLTTLSLTKLEKPLDGRARCGYRRRKRRCRSRSTGQGAGKPPIIDQVRSLPIKKQLKKKTIAAEVIRTIRCYCQSQIIFVILFQPI